MRRHGHVEVPGGGRTPSGPAVTVAEFARELCLFVRGTDNAVYQNIFNPASGWPGWELVPGAGQTFSEPRATFVGYELVNYGVLVSEAISDKIREGQCVIRY